MLKLRYRDSDISVESGIRYRDLLKDEDGPLKPMLARQAGEYFELDEEIRKEGEVFPVYITDSHGNKAYERTLSFILVVAVKTLSPGNQLYIEHSISRGLYCRMPGLELTSDFIGSLYDEMQRIIEGSHPIEKVKLSREEAFEVFRKEHMEDRIDLLKESGLESITLYRLLGHYDYFYGKMAINTGLIRLFGLEPYKGGFVLTYPPVYDPLSLGSFKPQDKLFGIFRETQEWDEIIGVDSIGYLNEKIINGEAFDLVRVTEALHEKKIAYIADEIAGRKDVRVVMIAGPSSSGKTTFTKRLGIQLRVNGLIPVAIGMDDYFVDREHTPKNPDGSYDFESLRALDLDLFQEHVMKLIDGEGVALPHFDFRTGKRTISENMARLPERGVLMIEGIHGLNPALFPQIPRESKFKVYISALTAMNMDRHNRIATTDVRKLRRMVRDILSRGYSASETLGIFPSVARGEKEHIYPYQEEADAMFNSTILYELAVLKKHCLKELRAIDKSSLLFEEAKRLSSILVLLRDIKDEMVPENSILREFIGGSCFYEY